MRSTRMRLSHVSWNFGGLALPLIMAAISIPNLLEILGKERFGVLTLAWGLIGYAGALDLGIGRATTHSISALRVGDAAEKLKIPYVLFTATRITISVGAIGALIMLTLLLIGAEKTLGNSRIEKSEIYISAALMTIALPMQALSSTYRGVNEAYLNFRSISVLRVALGVANFGLPLLIAMFSQKMNWLIGGIVFSRGFALYIYKILAEKCIADLKRSEPVFSSDIARELIRFGGWFTISSVLNPVVAIADRFIIASIISAAAVAVYVIPYEMVVQSLTIVGALTTVAFPYLSGLRISNPKNAAKVFNKLLLAVLGVMSFVFACYFYFGDKILELWLGKEYLQLHGKIIKILAFGLVSYTLGTMCISWLHAHGKTGTTAKLNLIEFPLHLMAVYIGVKFFGIEGAAFVWVGRVTINALILYYFACRSNAK